GDPIEVEALTDVYGRLNSSGPCLLGSVKTNIGHLGGAAGISRLHKVVLSLQRREVPPHLHFHTLNPNISLQQTRFAIPTSHMPWPDPHASIAAGRSFG